MEFKACSDTNILALSYLISMFVHHYNMVKVFRSQVIPMLFNFHPNGQQFEHCRNCTYVDPGHVFLAASVYWGTYSLICLTV